MMNTVMTLPWQPAPRTIENSRTGIVYTLGPAYDVPNLSQQVDAVTTICNQRSIYDILFDKRLHGAPYTDTQAKEFLTWAQAGWQRQEYFVFLVTEPSGLVVAAVDIKSADRKSAEIGYWCSELHRGLMSNAVHEVIDLAREGGFRELHARVRKDNPASRKVLERNGFVLTGDWPGDPLRVRYERAFV